MRKVGRSMCALQTGQVGCGLATSGPAPPGDPESWVPVPPRTHDLFTNGGMACLQVPHLLTRSVWRSATHGVEEVSRPRRTPSTSSVPPEEAEQVERALGSLLPGLVTGGPLGLLSRSKGAEEPQARSVWLWTGSQRSTLEGVDDSVDACLDRLVENSELASAHALQGQVAEVGFLCCRNWPSWLQGPERGRLGSLPHERERGGSMGS